MIQKAATAIAVRKLAKSMDNQNKPVVVNTQKNETLKYLILVGGGLILYDKIFGKSKDDKDKEAEEKKNRDKIEDAPADHNPFLYESYTPTKAEYAEKKKKGATKILTKTTAQYIALAKQIYQAWGILNDSEAKIIGAINSCRTTYDVSFVARAYFTVYKDDLYYELKDRLKESQLNEVLRVVNKLPIAV